MAEKKKRVGIVTAGKLRVRKGPGVDKEIDAIVNRNTALDITTTRTDKTGEKWYKTPAGWVMARWIEVREG